MLTLLLLLRVYMLHKKRMSVPRETPPLAPLSSLSLSLSLLSRRVTSSSPSRYLMAPLWSSTNSATRR